MEAGSRLRRFCVGMLPLLLIGTTTVSVQAANQRTQNFLVHAPSQALANQVAEAAERYRRDLATYWLGQPLPPWPAPCPIRVVSGPNLAAQGVTTYNPRPVRDFQMEVVGTPERILDSVLPHEVTHTILATHFGRPLPRWADEGICTTVEHHDERHKHEIKLREFLRSRRGIAMNQMFLMTEYPHDVLPLYAQGYSVCRFLIAQKGPRTFINFLQDYMHRPSWTANVKKHYEYDSLKELQDYWLAWVDEGSTDVTKYAKVQIPTAGTGSLAQSTPQTGTAPQTRLAQVNTPRRSQALTLLGPRGTNPVPIDRSSVNPLSIKSVAVTPERSSIARSTVLGPAPGAARQDVTGNATPIELTAAMPPVQGTGRAGQATGIVGEATALASTTSDGWYQRKRSGVAERVIPTTQPNAPVPPRSPIAPPSVQESGRYQSAQPQPEQGMTRTPMALGGQSLPQVYRR